MFCALLTLLLLLFDIAPASTTTANTMPPSSSTQEKTSDSIETVASPRDESSDILKRWSKRWESSDTPGWHEKDVHPMLLRYFDEQTQDLKTTCSSRNSSPSDDEEEQKQQSRSLRVLVPLCGKTVDLAYLAKHDSVSDVVGVDGIQRAMDTFIEENPDLYNNYKDADGKVAAEPCGKRNQFLKYDGAKISMLKGDFFELGQDAVLDNNNDNANKETGRLFDVVWDRASLVAINPEKREEYVQVLSTVMSPGGVIVLVALDKRTGTDEARAYGPPYSLPEEEIRRLFEDQDWVESIEKLEEHDESITYPEKFQRWKDMGLTSMFEMLFVIRTKES